MKGNDDEKRTVQTPGEQREQNDYDRTRIIESATRDNKPLESQNGNIQRNSFEKFTSFIREQTQSIKALLEDTKDRINSPDIKHAVINDDTLLKREPLASPKEVLESDTQERIQLNRKEYLSVTYGEEKPLNLWITFASIEQLSNKEALSYINSLPPGKALIKAMGKAEENTAIDLEFSGRTLKPLIVRDANLANAKLFSVESLKDFDNALNKIEWGLEHINKFPHMFTQKAKEAFIERAEKTLNEIEGYVDKLDRDESISKTRKIVDGKEYIEAEYKAKDGTEKILWTTFSGIENIPDHLIDKYYAQHFIPAHTCALIEKAPENSFITIEPREFQENTKETLLEKELTHEIDLYY